MEENISIDAMIAQMIEDAKQLGYSETSIWCDMVPRWRAFSNYYTKKGVSSYDPEITNEFVYLQRERRDRDEISANYLRMITYAAKRLNQYYLSGTEDVTVDLVRNFILKTAAEVKLSTLHDIMLYLKHFHRYLKDSNIAAPDCVELFSYTVCREMPVQGYVTDEELNSVLNVIDTTTEAGKRDRAMILIAATTGLRACDLIRLKLTDVDWEKTEIKLVRQKTSRTVYCSLLREAGEALQDYILNARPKTGCSEIFLRTVAPKTAISTAAAVGFMFKTYQTRAGIRRHPFDGKGFHGLRRRLAKKLLVSGTPLTTIIQILGHSDMGAVRQYLSLDTGNLMECALDFRGIPVEREALL